MQVIMARIEAAIGAWFNALLMNLYRDGQDGIADMPNLRYNFIRESGVDITSDSSFLRVTPKKQRILSYCFKV